MPITVAPPSTSADVATPSPPRFDRIAEARGRRVAVLTVHHVRLGDRLQPGGAEKYVRTVIRALLDAGARVHVGYSGHSIYADLLESYDPRDLTVEHTGWLNDVISGDRRLRLRTLRARRRWFHATGADTVFAVQQAGGGAFVASLVAARSLGLRAVASLRQQPQPLPAPTGKRWLGLIPSPEVWRRRLIWRCRLPALCCHALIYNSDRVADAYAHRYSFPKRRARVIPNGEFPTQRAPRGRGPLRIAAVGRITRAKGADTVLEAFLLVARKYPGCTLSFYGDGPLAAPLAERARAYGLAGRVRFPGYLAAGAGLWEQVDLCVQTSRREAMANSVIEAMARGIPCVVSDVGGLPETVVHGESGYVVPAGDPRALATALDRLLGDPSRRERFGAAALSRARARFDLRRLMRETVETILGL
ncbi:MAG: glycosyltransferase family 4 protein [Phycisphaerae bacterium]